MEVWRSGNDFRATLEAVPEVNGLLSAGELVGIFDLDKSIRNVDEIFQRAGLG
jgi:hypothetical protein